MEFKHTIEILTKDIQDIEKLVDNFNNYSSIPNIELELALAKLRNVYDVLLMLRENTLSTSTVAKTEEPKSIPKPNKVTDKKHTVPAKDKVPSLTEEELTKSINEIESSKTPEAGILEIENIPTQEKKSSHAKKSIPKTQKIVAEKFSQDKTYLNEMLWEQLSKTDISAIHQLSPIKTISGSIGLNDKFLLIRELFSNDHDLFKKTMTELDNSANFNAAYSLLMNNFSWDMKSEPVQLLLNLLRRKFISPGNE